jgi:hypothetical protein
MASSERSFDGTKNIQCSNRRESGQVGHHRHTTAGFYMAAYLPKKLVVEHDQVQSKAIIWRKAWAENCCH